MLIHLWRQANDRPESFMDHTGHLRDARTGKPLDDDGEDAAEVDATATPGDESRSWSVAIANK